MGRGGPKPGYYPRLEDLHTGVDASGDVEDTEGNIFAQGHDRVLMPQDELDSVDTAASGIIAAENNNDGRAETDRQEATNEEQEDLGVNRNDDVEDTSRHRWREHARVYGHASSSLEGQWINSSFDWNTNADTSVNEDLETDETQTKDPQTAENSSNADKGSHFGEEEFRPAVVGDPADSPEKVSEADGPALISRQIEAPIQHGVQAGEVSAVLTTEVSQGIPSGIRSIDEKEKVSYHLPVADREDSEDLLRKSPIGNSCFDEHLSNSTGASDCFIQTNDENKPVAINEVSSIHVTENGPLPSDVRTRSLENMPFSDDSKAQENEDINETYSTYKTKAEATQADAASVEKSPVVEKVTTDAEQLYDQLSPLCARHGTLSAQNAPQNTSADQDISSICPNRTSSICAQDAVPGIRENIDPAVTLPQQPCIDKPHAHVTEDNFLHASEDPGGSTLTHCAKDTSQENPGVTAWVRKEFKEKIGDSPHVKPEFELKPATAEEFEFGLAASQGGVDDDASRGDVVYKVEDTSPAKSSHKYINSLELSVSESAVCNGKVQEHSTLIYECSGEGKEDCTPQNVNAENKTIQDIKTDVVVNAEAARPLADSNDLGNDSSSCIDDCSCCVALSAGGKCISSTTPDKLTSTEPSEASLSNFPVSNYLTGPGFTAAFSKNGVDTLETEAQGGTSEAKLSRFDNQETYDLDAIIAKIDATISGDDSAKTLNLNGPGITPSINKNLSTAILNVRCGDNTHSQVSYKEIFSDNQGDTPIACNLESNANESLKPTDSEMHAAETGYTRHTCKPNNKSLSQFNDPSGIVAGNESFIDNAHPGTGLSHPNATAETVENSAFERTQSPQKCPSGLDDKGLQIEGALDSPNAGRNTVPDNAISTTVYQEDKSIISDSFSELPKNIADSLNSGHIYTSENLGNNDKEDQSLKIINVEPHSTQMAMQTSITGCSEDKKESHTFTQNVPPANSASVDPLLVPASSTASPAQPSDKPVVLETKSISESTVKTTCTGLEYEDLACSKELEAVPYFHKENAAAENHFEDKKRSTDAAANLEERKAIFCQTDKHAMGECADDAHRESTIDSRLIKNYVGPDKEKDEPASNKPCPVEGDYTNYENLIQAVTKAVESSGNKDLINDKSKTPPLNKKAEIENIFQDKKTPNEIDVYHAAQKEMLSYIIEKPYRVEDSYPNNTDLLIEKENCFSSNELTSKKNIPTGDEKEMFPIDKHSGTKETTLEPEQTLFSDRVNLKSDSVQSVGEKFSANDCFSESKENWIIGKSDQGALVKNEKSSSCKSEQSSEKESWRDGGSLNEIRQSSSEPVNICSNTKNTAMTKEQEATSDDVNIAIDNINTATEAPSANLVSINKPRRSAPQANNYKEDPANRNADPFTIGTASEQNPVATHNTGSGSSQVADNAEVVKFDNVYEKNIPEEVVVSDEETNRYTPDYTTEAIDLQHQILDAQTAAADVDDCDLKAMADTDTLTNETKNDQLIFSNQEMTDDDAEITAVAEANKHLADWRMSEKDYQLPLPPACEAGPDENKQISSQLFIQTPSFVQSGDSLTLVDAPQSDNDTRPDAEFNEDIDKDNIQSLTTVAPVVYTPGEVLCKNCDQCPLVAEFDISPDELDEVENQYAPCNVALVIPTNEGGQPKNGEEILSPAKSDIVTLVVSVARDIQQKLGAAMNDDDEANRMDSIKDDNQMQRSTDEYVLIRKDFAIGDSQSSASKEPDVEIVAKDLPKEDISTLSSEESHVQEVEYDILKNGTSISEDSLSKAESDVNTLDVTQRKESCEILSDERPEGLTTAAGTTQVVCESSIDTELGITTHDSCPLPAPLDTDLKKHEPDIEVKIEPVSQNTYSQASSFSLFPVEVHFDEAKTKQSPTFGTAKAAAGGALPAEVTLHENGSKKLPIFATVDIQACKFFPQVNNETTKNSDRKPLITVEMEGYKTVHSSSITEKFVSKLDSFTSSLGSAISIESKRGLLKSSQRTSTDGTTRTKQRVTFQLEETRERSETCSTQSKPESSSLKRSDEVEGDSGEGKQPEQGDCTDMKQQERLLAGGDNGSEDHDYEERTENDIEDAAEEDEDELAAPPTDSSDLVKLADETSLEIDLMEFVNVSEGSDMKCSEMRVKQQGIVTHAEARTEHEETLTEGVCRSTMSDADEGSLHRMSSVESLPRDEDAMAEFASAREGDLVERDGHTQSFESKNRDLVERDDHTQSSESKNRDLVERDGHTQSSESKNRDLVEKDSHTQSSESKNHDVVVRHDYRQTSALKEAECRSIGGADAAGFERNVILVPTGGFLDSNNRLEETLSKDNSGCGKNTSKDNGDSKTNKEIKGNVSMQTDKSQTSEATSETLLKHPENHDEIEDSWYQSTHTIESVKLEGIPANADALEAQEMQRSELNETQMKRQSVLEQECVKDGYPSKEAIQSFTASQENAYLDFRFEEISLGCERKEESSKCGKTAIELRAYAKEFQSLTSLELLKNVSNMIREECLETLENESLRLQKPAAELENHGEEFQSLASAESNRSVSEKIQEKNLETLKNESLRWGRAGADLRAYGNEFQSLTSFETYENVRTNIQEETVEAPVSEKDEFISRESSTGRDKTLTKAGIKLDEARFGEFKDDCVLRNGQDLMKIDTFGTDALKIASPLGEPGSNDTTLIESSTSVWEKSGETRGLGEDGSACVLHASKDAAPSFESNTQPVTPEESDKMEILILPRSGIDHSASGSIPSQVILLEGSTEITKKSEESDATQATVVDSSSRENTSRIEFSKSLSQLSQFDMSRLEKSTFGGPPVKPKMLDESIQCNSKSIQAMGGSSNENVAVTRHITGGNSRCGDGSEINADRGGAVLSREVARRSSTRPNTNRVTFSLPGAAHQTRERAQSLPRWRYTSKPADIMPRVRSVSVSPSRYRRGEAATQELEQVVHRHLSPTRFIRAGSPVHEMTERTSRHANVADRCQLVEDSALSAKTTQSAASSVTDVVKSEGLVHPLAKPYAIEVARLSQEVVGISDCTRDSGKLQTNVDSQITNAIALDSSHSESEKFIVLEATNDLLNLCPVKEYKEKDLEKSKDLYHGYNDPLSQIEEMTPQQASFALQPQSYPNSKTSLNLSSACEAKYEDQNVSVPKDDDTEWFVYRQEFQDLFELSSIRETDFSLGELSAKEENTNKLDVQSFHSVSNKDWQETARGANERRLKTVTGCLSKQDISVTQSQSFPKANTHRSLSFSSRTNLGFRENSLPRDNNSAWFAYRKQFQELFPSSSVNEIDASLGHPSEREDVVTKCSDLPSLHLKINAPRQELVEKHNRLPVREDVRTDMPQEPDNIEMISPTVSVHGEQGYMEHSTVYIEQSRSYHLDDTELGTRDSQLQKDIEIACSEGCLLDLDASPSSQLENNQASPTEKPNQTKELESPPTSAIHDTTHGIAKCHLYDNTERGTHDSELQKNTQIASNEVGALALATSPPWQLENTHPSPTNTPDQTKYVESPPTSATHRTTDNSAGKKADLHKLREEEAHWFMYRKRWSNLFDEDEKRSSETTYKPYVMNNSRYRLAMKKDDFDEPPCKAKKNEMPPKAQACKHSKSTEGSAPILDHSAAKGDSSGKGTSEIAGDKEESPQSSVTRNKKRKIPYLTPNRENIVGVVLQGSSSNAEGKIHSGGTGSATGGSRRSLSNRNDELTHVEQSPPPSRDTNRARERSLSRARHTRRSAHTLLSSSVHDNIAISSAASVSQSVAAGIDLPERSGSHFSQRFARLPEIQPNAPPVASPVAALTVASDSHTTISSSTFPEGAKNSQKLERTRSPNSRRPNRVRREPLHPPLMEDSLIADLSFMREPGSLPPSGAPRIDDAGEPDLFDGAAGGFEEGSFTDDTNLVAIKGVSDTGGQPVKQPSAAGMDTSFRTGGGGDVRPPVDAISSLLQPPLVTSGPKIIPEVQVLRVEESKYGDAKAFLKKEIPRSKTRLEVPRMGLKRNTDVSILAWDKSITPRTSQARTSESTRSSMPSKIDSSAQEVLAPEKAPRESQKTERRVKPKEQKLNDSRLAASLLRMKKAAKSRSRSPYDPVTSQEASTETKAGGDKTREKPTTKAIREHDKTEQPKRRPSTEKPAPRSSTGSKDRGALGAPKRKSSIRKVGEGPTPAGVSGSAKSGAAGKGSPSPSGTHGSHRRLSRTRASPGRILAEGHYQRSSNVINVVVKPINVNISKDQLNLKVQVHRKHSQNVPILPHPPAEEKPSGERAIRRKMRLRREPPAPLPVLASNILDIRAMNPPFNTTMSPEAHKRFQFTYGHHKVL